MRPLYPLKWALNTIPSFFLGHPVNVQLYQDFQNPVWGWLLVATILLFPTLILSSLASSFRAEISVSLQECYYWGPSWPTLIHWVPSQPTVLPHLCPSSHPLSCEASLDLESSLNPVFSVWPGLEQASSPSLPHNYHCHSSVLSISSVAMLDLNHGNKHPPPEPPPPLPVSLRKCLQTLTTDHF